MKILVTGGAGYIGSILVPLLLSDGHKVTAVDNFRYDQGPLLHCNIDPKLNIIRGDVRNESLMAKAMEGADALIPLACLTGAPVCQKHPEEARGIIVDAIKIMLKLRKPEQKIIYPTTDSAYGTITGMFCDENTPVNPISLYGRLKVEAEEAIKGSGNFVLLRLATLFGTSPRMRYDLVINDFVYRATHDKFIILFEADMMRNFIHVRDVAAAFVHALNNFDKIKNQYFNIGLQAANINKRQLCEEIKKQIPEFYFVEATIGEDIDKRNYIVNNEKFLKTGFVPKITLQEGIAEIIKASRCIARMKYSNV